MDLNSFNEDNRKNCYIDGVVPPKTIIEPCCLGIDEAGRGPVLGPMVYGICFSPISAKSEIESMGFADSKTLTEKKREEIFSKITSAQDTVGWIVNILSPNFISNSMLRRFKYNLNSLSHDTAAQLIQRALDKGVDVREVYVDTVGDPIKYQAKLKTLFPHIDIVVAKKADATYPIVGAASICAKVARDQVVENWKFREKIDFINSSSEESGSCYGSGYPSDPKTKKFLSSNVDRVFGFPQFVRHSWSTASSIMDNECALVQWEDDDDDEKQNNSKSENTCSVTSYFRPTSKTNKSRPHCYFSERFLSPLQNF